MLGFTGQLSSSGTYWSKWEWDISLFHFYPRAKSVHYKNETTVNACWCTLSKHPAYSLMRTMSPINRKPVLWKTSFLLIEEVATFGCYFDLTKYPDGFFFLHRKKKPHKYQFYPLTTLEIPHFTLQICQ